ncbi:PREDICTED: uncharacterized protein LOC109352881 [Lupinus angustifolius]|uniref:uncharacterized protein LOC109352881 n=1 Tax=Lupinus angustifolius TaxID=3871 RepID=UPI00092FC3C7|nr:PREDICTED: uncharacterized protein LOC109352881 [Lupinus angustifolius]
MGADRTKEVALKVAELLEAGFICEITYTTWLANVVLVKKPSGKWRMCVDYTDLNKDISTCPSWTHTSATIRSRCTPPPDQEKTAFITDQTAYCYTVMPFGLKNAGATYQRMMSKVFAGQTGEHMEVYMDDMIAKSLPSEDHPGDRSKSFQMSSNHRHEKPPHGQGGPTIKWATSRAVQVPPIRCETFTLPLFQLLKKSKKFEWSESCEAAFNTFKQYLAAPPILSKPLPEEILYQKLEKVAYALLVATRRLRQYFQSHTTIVRTNQPIRKILHKPELVGRMITWSIELSQFDICFEPRTAIKSQVLSDFVAELAAPEGGPEQVWTIFVDGSSNPRGSGAGILLEDGQGVTIEHSLTFTFPTSNNQAEYEACIVGLQLAKEVGARKVLICSDSQLAVSQVSGAYQTKDALLGKYLLDVKELMANFDEAIIQHVPRESNA